MKIIITGSTGMIGNGVFEECLQNKNIESILLINKTPLGIKHKKIKEIIHQDFFNLTGIEKELTNYDACFFCLGTSSYKMKEQEYSKITHDLTLNFANTLLTHNKNMTFCYVSAMGADNTLKSKTMWERVKGRAENSLLKLNFKNVYIFRAAITKPDANSPKRTMMHKVSMPLLRVLYPLLKLLFPKYSTTTQNIALAMINVSNNTYDNKHLEIEDVNNLSREGKKYE